MTLDTHAPQRHGRRASSRPSRRGAARAARYRLDRDAAIAVHEAGYSFSREHGGDEWAARLAIQLSYDAYAFRGLAEAAGWIERAAMLVEGKPPALATSDRTTSSRRRDRPRRFYRRPAAS